MAKKRAAKAGGSPGDIFEVPVGGKLGYIQFVYHERKGNSGHGDFVRVLPGLHKQRPASFAELVREPEAFGVFFPAYLECRAKQITKVGHEPLPANYERPKAFQSSVLNPIRKKTTWFVTDAKTLTTERVRRVTKSLRSLPLYAIVNLPALVRMMQFGWKPEYGYYLPTGEPI